MIPGTPSPPPTGQAGGRGRLPCLDGLRAIAILGVVYSHARSTFSTESRWLDATFGHGHLGVSIFFVLSGYLITRLLRMEWEANSGIHLRDFYGRRVLRIFPAFYLFLGVMLGLSAGGLLSISREHFASAATFTWNYKHVWSDAIGDGNWFLGHLWSLSLEEQFYLFWPAMLVLFGLSRAPLIPVGLILVSPVVRVAAYFLWPEARGQLGMMLHTASDKLMFGCLLALWEGRAAFEEALRRFRSPLWATCASIFLVFVSPWFLARFGGAYGVPFGITLDGLGIAFVIVWLLRHPTCLAGRILNSRPFVFVGVLSYSLYLWQQLFLTPLNTTWTGRFPTNILCTFAAAAVSYYAVEQPFLRLRRLFQPVVREGPVERRPA